MENIMSYSESQLALKAHIEAENAQHPTSPFSVTADLEHWANYDITTVAQYDHYMAQETHRDIYREINGIKPTFINYEAMSTEEIRADIGSMINDEEQTQAQEKAEEALLLKNRKKANAYQPNFAFADLKSVLSSQ